MMQDVNQNHAHPFIATQLREKLTFTDMAWGVRFSAIVDESGGSVPRFFIRAVNDENSIIGIQIDQDRSRPLVCRAGEGCEQ